jgi:hypothetical protein
MYLTWSKSLSYGEHFIIKVTAQAIVLIFNNNNIYYTSLQATRDKGNLKITTKSYIASFWQTFALLPALMLTLRVVFNVLVFWLVFPL